MQHTHTQYIPMRSIICFAILIAVPHAIAGMGGCDVNGIILGTIRPSTVIASLCGWGKKVIAKASCCSCAKKTFLITNRDDLWWLTRKSYPESCMDTSALKAENERLDGQLRFLQAALYVQLDANQKLHSANQEFHKQLKELKQE